MHVTCGDTGDKKTEDNLGIFEMQAKTLFMTGRHRRR